MLPRLRGLLWGTSPLAWAPPRRTPLPYPTPFHLPALPTPTRRLTTTAAAAEAAAPTDTPAGTSPAPAATAAAVTHLKSLEIKDFALVAHQHVSLQPGFNVITGESGSGKSVLIEALGQLLGAPAADDAVRPPATSAVVEGTVAVAPSDQPALRALLSGLGLPARALSRGLDAVTIRREIVAGAGGTRSKCTLNGSITSLRVLREVGRALVDVNGQHAALSVRDGGTQLELLDRLAGLGGAAAALDAAWRQLQAARSALKALDDLADEEDRAVLQSLVDDVMGAGVEPGEDVMLRQRLRQLDARRDAAERCALVSTGLGGGSGSGGIADALHDVELHVRAVLSQEDRLRAAAEAEAAENEENEEESELNDDGDATELLREAMAALDAARDSLEAAQSSVERYARQYRFSAAEHAEVSERLQELKRLMKEHDAGSADELLAAADKASNDLDAFYQMEGRRDELEADLAGKEAAMAALAAELSAARRAAAERLRDAVAAVLGELAMPHAAFDVRMTWTSAATPGSGVRMDSDAAARCGVADGPGVYKMRQGGLDSVEFLFAAGPEEPLRPLSAVASGGEAARVMLAIKAAPAFLAGTDAEGERGRAAMEAVAAAQDGDDAAAASPPPLGAPIVVLDEIDSGVGSRLGQPIGRILRRMAGPGEAQVLCVSHLPAVAAHADYHICVRKAADGDGRVVSTFEALMSTEERRAEVAAMLGLPEAAAEELMAAAATAT